MNPRIGILVLAALLPGTTLAQNPGGSGADTSAVLPAVEVRAPDLRGLPTGTRIESFDTLRTAPYRSQHLGDLLTQEGGVYVKSYGGSSLATASIRGGGAAHTAVLWNGLPIQHPMLGLVDLSLLPMGFFDQVEVRYGGQSTAWGSGAIGGLIDLGSAEPVKGGAPLAFRVGLGSFGLRHGLGEAAYGKAALRGRTRMLVHQARNDFPFRIRPDLPEQRLEHAALQQAGLTQDLFWRPRPNEQFALSVWGQWVDRELPPTTVQARSRARQEDAFLRTALRWRRVGRRVVWRARAGLFREYLDFRDPRAAVRSISRHWLASGDFSGAWQWGSRLRLELGATGQWAEAETGGYARPVRQYRVAPFLLTRLELGAWTVQADLRQELVDGQAQPLLPALAVQGGLTPWLDLRVRLSRNYRTPTLNDLYWVPGGNPDLLPESGWSQEAAARLHGRWDGWTWYYDLGVYSRQVANWMLWSQPEGQAFFSVRNIARVWSRGLEQRLGLRGGSAHWATTLEAGLDLQRSTNQVAIDRPRIDAGEQLFYTPTHLAYLSVRLRWHRLSLGYRHRFTGPVSTLSGDSLPAFQLGDADLNYHWPLGRHALQFFLRGRNLWNTTYRVIEYRPMPGRHAELGLTWSLDPKT